MVRFFIKSRKRVERDKRNNPKNVNLFFLHASNEEKTIKNQLIEVKYYGKLERRDFRSFPSGPFFDRM
jgi:hypothetical protein